VIPAANAAESGYDIFMHILLIEDDHSAARYLIQGLAARFSIIHF